MPQNARGPEGDKQAADERPMSYTPGSMQEKENASARANRADESDTTSLPPERARPREDESERPGEHGDTRQPQEAADGSDDAVPPLDSSADPLR